MNIPWVEVDPPVHLAEFLTESGSPAGHLLALSTGKYLWVGNINDVGGVCDDCTDDAMRARSEIRVIAYWNATLAVPKLDLSAKSD